MSKAIGKCVNFGGYVSVLEEEGNHNLQGSWNEP